MSELTQNTLEHLQSTLVITKGKKVEEGQFEAVLSTDDLDRHGEHVSVAGLVIPKNQVIKMYYNHQTYGEALPIGKWLKVWKSGGKLMGLGEIDMEDQFAVKIYKKILKGYIDSISIGFYPQEFDSENTTWTKSTLVEASVVAEPANTAAVITSKELGYTEEEFNESLKVKLKEVTKSDAEQDEADPPEEEPLPEQISVDGADSAEVKSIIEDLKSRVGALESAHEASNENPTTKNLIKVRLAAKEVDKTVEEINKVIKVKLKDSQNE